MSNVTCEECTIYMFGNFCKDVKEHLRLEPQLSKDVEQQLADY